jgi:hypothetical protein
MQQCKRNRTTISLDGAGGGRESMSTIGGGGIFFDIVA